MSEAGPVEGVSRIQALRFIQSSAPNSISGKIDNRTLQVGGLCGTVKRVVIAPYPSGPAISTACSRKDTLLVTAASLIRQPVRSLLSDEFLVECIRDLLHSRAALLVLAGRWRRSFASAVLAERLGLADIRALAPHRGPRLVKLAIFVPTEHLDRVRAAAAHAGAGSIGNYRECSFATSGCGTFTPGEGAQPWFGSVGTLARIDEVRLEMTAAACNIGSIMDAVRSVHPYEEVAFDVYLLQNRAMSDGAGRVGRLNEPVDRTALVGLVNRALGLAGVTSARCSGAETSVTEWLAITAGRANEAVIRSAASFGVSAVVCCGHSVKAESLARAAGVALIEVGFAVSVAPGLAEFARGATELFGPHGVEVAFVN
ncbi:MAG: Nif3-like dinuclear metal center hexameric protein [Armatimonadetes bacterium]|nr:Nif3-like dinuclear metal center hexameric protein [Armatimonadota bacterium]MDE2206701.1 Nif3-like dinuclear metal center hexameric protein [Armatimonadota bacterium]